jgi:fructose-bisphosphate aldolase class I
MNRFIAAMDHSGGSTGGVLERYEQEYTEENKMDLVNDMRLRMINSPKFTSTYIWAAILYKDSVDKGLAYHLNAKDIKPFLKIDSGCEDNGYLKYFRLDDMITYAHEHGCYGTKMRSIVKTALIMPMIQLYHMLDDHLKEFDGKCIFKLTLPETPNLYKNFTNHPKVEKVVGLSGGYSTLQACDRLGQQDNVSASFSRALSEGLYAHQTDDEFTAKISDNIKRISNAS